MGGVVALSANLYRIFFAAVCACLLPINLYAARLTEPMDQKSISARIQPIGSVNVVDASGAAVVAVETEELGPDAGERRYKLSCATCHDSGLANAPKFRNKADWAPRIGVGVDALLASAIKGKGGMPPKGTCMKCSDQELRLSIEYMLPQ